MTNRTSSQAAQVSGQPLRDATELAKLPELERKEWQLFWDEIATLRKKVDGN